MKVKINLLGIAVFGFFAYIYYLMGVPAYPSVPGAMMIFGMAVGTILM